MRRWFHYKYTDIWVSAYSTILKPVNKLHSTGSSLGKKYTKQDTVLTNKKATESGARLEHPPCKYLTWLAEQEEAVMTTEWEWLKYYG
jgi:hypothetical protein